MIITTIDEVSCIGEFFWAYFKKQEKKYEKKQFVIQ